MSGVSVNQAETQQALAHAIAGGHLPSNVMDRAERLHTRLGEPTRITLMGMPGTGKTGVLNLLAGGQVVPAGVSIGTVQVSYGDSEKTSLTLNDGSTLERDGLFGAKDFDGLQPVLTKFEAPLPALTKISLMELGPAADWDGYVKAVSWASKQTDIAIWCTDSFGDAEMSLWQVTPDHLRDHSVLLRTRSDLLGAKLNETVATLESQAGEEFAYVLAVSAKEAHAAGTGKTVNKDRLRKAGGTKLISTLLREIEMGLQHTVDQADILLRMHNDAIVAQATAAIKDTPQEDAPEPEAPAEAPQVEIAKEPVVAETADAPTPPEPEAVASPDAEEDDQAELSENTVVIFRSAADRLQQVGVELAAKPDLDTREVLEASAEALTWLNEHLEDADLPRNPAVTHLCAMAQDADDLVQLLRIERQGDADLDAVLALLQLKREFQAVLAA